MAGLIESQKGLSFAVNRGIKKTAFMASRTLEHFGVHPLVPPSVKTLSEIPFRNIKLPGHNTQIEIFGDSMLRPGGKKPWETTEKSVSDYIEEFTHGKVCARNNSIPGSTTEQIYETLLDEYPRIVELPSDVVVGLKPESLNDARSLIRSDSDLVGDNHLLPIPTHVLRLYPEFLLLMKETSLNTGKLLDLYENLAQDRLKRWGDKYNTALLYLTEPPFFKAKTMVFEPTDGSMANPSLFKIQGHPVNERVAYLMTAAFIKICVENILKLTRRNRNIIISGLSLLHHNLFDSTGHLPQKEQRNIGEEIVNKLELD